MKKEKNTRSKLGIKIPLIISIIFVILSLCVIIVTVSRKDNLSSDTEPTDVPARPEKVVEVYDYKNKFCEPTYKQLIYYDEYTGNSLPYCLLLPENYTPSKEYPLVLLLHGAGERGSDNIKQTTHFNNMYTSNGDLLSDVIALCPQCPSDGWWNIDGFSYGDEKGWLGSAMRLLENIEDNYSCDKDRIYVTGLSMGGYATWSLLERYSDVFAAGVPVCGWGDTSKGSVLVDVPIWIYHGTNDDTVSFKSSSMMYESIIKAGGIKAHFTQLNGVNHNAWDYAYVDREMISWLLSQDKSSNPDSEYDYIPYLKILDANGNTVISDDDICLISYSSNDDFTKDMILTLEDYAIPELKAAYIASKGKPFTFYYGNQKLFTFKANGTLTYDTIVIDDTIQNTIFYSLYENLQRVI